MTTRAVLFDLDGTLLDTLEDLASAVNRTLRKFGLPPRTSAEIRTFVGNGARRLVSGAAGDVSPAVLERMLRAYRADYALHSADSTVPYDGVPALLAALSARGFAIGIVSNKPDADVRALCGVYFPDVPIGAVLGEQAGLCRKPAPDMLFAAMRELGSDAAHTVYVGDSEVDLETARNAGLPCIGVTWGFRSREALRQNGAALLADTPQELQKLLTALL